MMAHIGLALALATILHAFKLYHMPQGGSITLGSMIPLLLMAFFYGPAAGYLTGFLYGLVNLIQDPFQYISGIVFFASYAPAGISPYLYSFLFNASYLSMECIVCVVIMRMLPVEQLK